MDDSLIKENFEIFGITLLVIIRASMSSMFFSRIPVRVALETTYAENFQNCSAKIHIALMPARPNLGPLGITV